VCLFLTGKKRELAAQILGLRFTVPNQATATARALESDFVTRLARFFPDATPVRIPIRLSRAPDAANGNEHRNGQSSGNGDSATPANGWCTLQETVIEFGTPNEVFFMVAQPLEFADRVLVESRDGSLRAEASVVAVQYHPERTVVAARFLKPVPNWIVKS
jgi:hypothetical protein